MISERVNTKRILNYTKTIFFAALTTLVTINTLVLAFLVPIVGHHISPDSQAIAELWRTVGLVMQGCLTVIILSLTIYTIVKILEE